MKLMNKKLFLLLPLVVLLILLLWLVGGRRALSLINSRLPGGYQAVTLANGAAYFGKVQQMDSNTLTLEDVFYLKARVVGAGGKTPAQNPFELIKLGNEVHGPTDRMRVNRRQILSLQELRSDSKVVVAINDYYKAQKGR